MKLTHQFLISFLLVLHYSCIGYGKNCAESGTAFPISELPNSVSSVLSAPLERYEASKIELLGTSFLIIARVEGGLGRNKISKAICLAWPKWRQIFSNRIEQVAIIDSDEQLIGGGAVEANVLNIYLGGSVPAQVVPLIESILGWAGQSTATNYILKYYEDFESPIQAYVNDTVTHELGHLFFGWGITQVHSDAEKWFPLGMGLIYDRIVWNQISNKKSPWISAIVDTYLEKFSKILEVDQRLVNPNTENDSDFLLVRHSTYNHGKALVYLNEVRNRLGIMRFDDLIRAYLARPYGSAISYDDFLNYLTLKELEIVKLLETEFKVR